MSNNSDTVLTMFCIVTFIAYMPSLETNALSAFAQTDNNNNNIALDNSQVSDISNHTLNGGLSSWVCFTEFDHTDCKDMSNASSTYIGLVAGAAIGGVISWWIYNRQNKTSNKQDHILNHIERIERKNREILTHLETYAKHHDLVLNKILLLNQSIEALDKKIKSKEE